MSPATARFFLSLLLLGLLAVACGGSPATTTATTAPPATATTEEMVDEEMGDVLEVAAAEGDLGTFLTALEAAGIMEDFHGEGPFTLFIPTDAAFTAYLDESEMSQEEVFAGARCSRRSSAITSSACWKTPKW